MEPSRKERPVLEVRRLEKGCRMQEEGVLWLQEQVQLGVELQEEKEPSVAGGPGAWSGETERPGSLGMWARTFSPQGCFECKHFHPKHTNTEDLFRKWFAV